MDQMRCFVLLLCFCVPGVMPGQAQQVRTAVEVTATLEEGYKAQITQSLEAVLAAFNMAYEENRLPDLSSEHVTDDGAASILELWSRSPFRSIHTVVSQPLVRRPSDGLFEFRGVTLHLEDAAGEVFTEEGLFLINEAGRIADFKFGLDLHRYTQILEERKSISDFRSRQFILDFVDNFRTAYNRKDLSFLEKVFSENALIIVGRVIRDRMNNELSDNLMEGLGTDQVEYIKQNKREYLDRLGDVFERNEYIKVEFDSISVYSHAKVEGIYGVQMFQYWHSYSTRKEGYQDEGYLFLMIDLRDIDTPMIHVRTWQPEAFTSPDEVISLSNFRIVG